MGHGITQWLGLYILYKVFVMRGSRFDSPLPDARTAFLQVRNPGWLLLRRTAGYLSFGPIEQNIMFFVTSACARRTGAAARVERRRRER